MSTQTRPARERSRSAVVWSAAAIDLVAVIAFAATGRASHDEAAFGVGLLTTAWPFVAALAIGWILTRAWRAPHAILRTGVPLWLITVVGGMLLRLASDQGTALPFIIVATLTLGLLLVGWRAVATFVTRRRARV